MQLLFHGKGMNVHFHPFAGTFKPWLIMKLMAIFLLAACLQLHAKGFSQNISLTLKEAPLSEVFREIRKQTGFDFFYKDDLLKKAGTVTINVKNANIDEVLRLCLKDKPFDYTVYNKTVVIKEKKEDKGNLLIDVRGKVTNEKEEPVIGATVTVKGSNIMTVTDNNGEFLLYGISDDAILVITGAEIETIEARLNKRTNINLVTRIKENELDKVIMVAYGSTTKRYSTGNISKVGSDEITMQPVSNPIAALQGRVPGMQITQTSGVPGSAFKIQIQGQQSLGARGPSSTDIITSNDPLIIIDGVPFAAGNGYLNKLISASGTPEVGSSNAGGLSPLNLINPFDIESIEVLKDADATSIYGSRGANGVILITTKKGTKGKTNISLSAYSGFSKVTRTMRMLNTSEYLAMRREGIANDGAAPQADLWYAAGYAPDLILWDTTKFTDWKKFLIGNTAKNTDVQASISGGTGNTSFRIAGGYHKETTVFPGDFYTVRGSLAFNLTHLSNDKRLRLDLTGNYSANKTNSNSSDLTPMINLPPNFPDLLDSSGRLKWADKGVGFNFVGVINPLSYLFQEYKGETKNLLTNLAVSYQLLYGLTVKANFGINSTKTDETLISPIKSQNPANAPTGNSNFSNNSFNSWIIEPQINYTRKIGNGSIDILLGSTIQEQKNSYEYISGTGYNSDDLLYSLKGAASLSAANDYSQYKYAAIFGRVNYNWKDKYILNVTSRRDGSSRFSPQNQYANFAAAGFAWIFTNERFLKRLAPLVSFGKIKFSYGATGNDQIGNYQYLNSWGNNISFPYQNTPTLNPLHPFNHDFAWEVNRKFSAGIDIAFVKDRIVFSGAYYRNRNSNQLVSYPLPTQTGFGNLAAKNIPALVQNQGIELSITSTNLKGKEFSWKSYLTFTMNRNKLISFPGLESSVYSLIYVEGKSVNVINQLNYLGVDPATGVYLYQDLNGDESFNTKDYVVRGARDPKFFGGFGNSFTFKNLELDFLFEFKKQLGQNYLGYSNIARPPGFFVNQPALVLDRWQKPGDNAPIEKYTASYSSQAYTFIYQYMTSSNGIYSDASYIRLKNLSIAYTLKFLDKINLQNSRIFIQGQNLLTLTHYKGPDPETQTMYSLPPLKTFVAGIQVNF